MTHKSLLSDEEVQQIRRNYYNPRLPKIQVVNSYLEQDFQDEYCQQRGLPIRPQNKTGVDYIERGAEYEFVLNPVCDLKDVFLYPQRAAERHHTYRIVFSREPAEWVSILLLKHNIDYEICRNNTKENAKRQAQTAMRDRKRRIQENQ